jgi:hypothetical protein
LISAPKPASTSAPASAAKLPTLKPVVAPFRSASACAGSANGAEHGRHWTRAWTVAVNTSTRQRLLHLLQSRPSISWSWARYLRCLQLRHLIPLRLFTHTRPCRQRPRSRTRNLYITSSAPYLRITESARTSRIASSEPPGAQSAPIFFHLLVDLAGLAQVLVPCTAVSRTFQPCKTSRTAAANRP